MLHMHYVIKTPLVTTVSQTYLETFFQNYFLQFRVMSVSQLRGGSGGLANLNMYRGMFPVHVIDY